MIKIANLQKSSNKVEKLAQQIKQLPDNVSQMIAITETGQLYISSDLSQSTAQWYSMSVLQGHIYFAKIFNQKLYVGGNDLHVNEINLLNGQVTTIYSLKGEVQNLLSFDVNDYMLVLGFRKTIVQVNLLTLKHVEIALKEELYMSALSPDCKHLAVGLDKHIVVYEMPLISYDSPLKQERTFKFAQQEYKDHSKAQLNKNKSKANSEDEEDNEGSGDDNKTKNNNNKSSNKQQQQKKQQQLTSHQIAELNFKTNIEFTFLEDDGACALLWLNHSNDQFFYGDAEGKIGICDVNTRKVTPVVKLEGGLVYSLAIVQESTTVFDAADTVTRKTILAAGTDHNLSIIDVYANQLLKTIEFNTVYFIEFAQPNLLSVTELDGIVTILDTQNDYEQLWHHSFHTDTNRYMYGALFVTPDKMKLNSVVRMQKLSFNQCKNKQNTDVVIKTFY